MCSIAAPRAALGFGATAIHDRQRGVALVTPVARGAMAREPARCVGAEASSVVRTQKRARDNLDGKTGARDREGSAAGEVSVVVPAPGQQRLQERMKAELEAIRDLHRKAMLLCRGAGRGDVPPAVKGDAGSRRAAPSETAAKRRKTSPFKPAIEVAQQIKAVKPAQQKTLVPRVAALPLPSESKIKKTKELQKMRRMEEIARAREECRRQVLEVEMAALPDETIHPRDWEELGIAEFEHAVTRTRSQARSQDFCRSSYK